jgi:uncharacterized membrane protein (UPF0136 family)
MLIVWGTKRVERKAGAVADWCFVCRELRAFELVQISKVGHLYYIPLGSGTVVDHAIRCRECGARFGCDRGLYADPVKHYAGDLDGLVRATHPEWRRDHAERLALEEKTRREASALTPAERAARIIEPFELLNGMVVQRYASSTQFDRESGLGCFGAVVVAGAVLVVAGQLEDKARDWVAFGGLAIALFGVFYTLVQLHFAPSRWVRRKIVPMLARSIARLAPLREEVDEALRFCRQSKLRIGKATKSKDLWAALQSPEFAPPR